MFLIRQSDGKRFQWDAEKLAIWSPNETIVVTKPPVFSRECVEINIGKDDGSGFRQFRPGRTIMKVELLTGDQTFYVHNDEEDKVHV